MQAAEPTDAPLAKDIRDIQSLDAVNSLLAVVCKTTGMRFSAVARVTDRRWTALAVRDEISFGLLPGQDLPLDTTLCKESRAERRPIIIEQASADPVYATHHTPRIYNIESYVSVPIILSNDAYFGNLCAIDPLPHKVTAPHVVEMFNLFAQLIASQLENLRRLETAEAQVETQRVDGELREQFIAILGHDLRTPLSVISTGAETIRRAKSQPETVERLAVRVAASARRMRELVDDMQDFARGRLGGGLGVQIAPESSLGAALEQVVGELRDGYPDRIFDVAIEIAQTVHCDRARIQQLISNLVANALVHGSPTAPVVVRASVEGEQLVMSVSNQGPAIPADIRPRIFEAFARGAQHHSSHGMGLGLYICEQIARAHRGTIDVTSSEHAGTVFTAVLPVAGPKV